MVEKRALKRSVLHQNCKVFDIQTNKLIGHAIDMTVHGLKINSFNDYTPGQRLELRIELPEEIPGKRSIRFSGLVRWSLPDENPNLALTGIQIYSISPEDGEAIIALMAQYSFSLS